MGKKLLICEKPSMAKSVAEALKVSKKGNNYENDRFVISSLVGHIMEFRSFKDYPEIKKFENEEGKLLWKNINLPFVPREFIYEVKKDKKEVYKNVIEQINRNDIEVIYNVGDPDNEGQVLVDNPIQASKTLKPIKRLFLDDITTETVKKALEENIDNTSKRCTDMYASGRARAEIDWIYGMNMTIYASVKAGTLLKVGRIKVPIIDYIYTRDMAIENFVPEKYFSVESKTKIGEFPLNLISKKEFDKLSQENAERYAKVLNSYQAEITKLEKKQVKKQPNILWNANNLKTKAAKMLKVSGKEIEDTMQKLYEAKYISYPRSDSQCIPETSKEKIKSIINILNDNRLIFKEEKRIFNDKKIIQGHSAIIITENMPNMDNLSKLEKDVYNIIKNRFCANFCLEDCLVDQTSIEITVGPEIFKKKGEVLKQEGHNVFEKVSLSGELPPLEKGQKFDVDFKVVNKLTNPPAKITADMLNNYLEHPFKDENTYDIEEMTEEEFNQVAQGLKIGTSATRTNAIDECVKGEYLDYNTKTTIYSITEVGKKYMETINTLGIDLKKEKSVKLNSDITRITNGELTLEEVVKKSEEDLKELVEKNKAVKIEKFNNVNTGKTIGKFNGKEVFKKKTKVGNVYSTVDNSFVLFENAMIYGTKVKLLEKDVKDLLLGRNITLTLFSKKTQKDYDALIGIDGLNEKGYPNFKMNGFPQKGKEKTSTSSKKEKK
jgi:DNA topoisomerase